MKCDFILFSLGVVLSCSIRLRHVMKTVRYAVRYTVTFCKCRQLFVFGFMRAWWGCGDSGAGLLAFWFALEAFARERISASLSVALYSSLNGGKEVCHFCLFEYSYLICICWCHYISSFHDMIWSAIMAQWNQSVNLNLWHLSGHLTVQFFSHSCWFSRIFLRTCTHSWACAYVQKLTGEWQRSKYYALVSIPSDFDANMKYLKKFQTETVFHDSSDIGSTGC